MTSSRLFFNLLRENIRRQLWCIVVLLLVCFFCFPVLTAMNLEESVWSLYHLCSTYSAVSGLLLMLSGGAALILAMSGFKHLHSSRMTDCYHALPVKRGLLFASQYTSGVVIYAGAYLLGLLAAVIVVASKGVPVKYILPNLLYGYFYFLLVFLMVYTITVIAVELTGKLLIGVMGTAYLCFYVAAVFGLVGVLSEMFFESYSSRSQQDVFGATQWISPLSRLIQNYEWMENRPADCIFKSSELWNDQLQFLENVRGTTMVVTMLPASVIIGMLVMIAVLITAAVLLFLKRRSESAGSAMAFAVSRPIIKFLTVVPVGAVVGVIFCLTNGEESLGWLIFGTLCGSVIACCGMEVIYQADIRAIFRKKKDLLASVVVTMLVICFFRFDWGGYDNYLPEKTELAGVSFVFEFDGIESRVDLSTPYMSYDRDYQFEQESYQDIDTIYPLLQYLATEAEAYEEPEEMAAAIEIGGSADIALYSYSYPYTYEHSQRIYSMTVGYHLKNGKTVYRDYYLHLKDAKLCELINAVYQTEEYKRMLHAVCRDEIMDYMAGVRLEGKLDSALSTDNVKNKEFLEIYRKEYLKLSLYDMMSSSVLYTVDFLIDAERRVVQDKEFNSTEYAYMDSVTYPIYECFTESIAWLEENLKLEEDENFYENIDWMTVYDQFDGGIYEFQKGKDAEIIKQLYTEMITENQFVIYADYQYYVEMYATWLEENEDGRLVENGRYFNGYLMPGNAGILTPEKLQK